MAANKSDYNSKTHHDATVAFEDSDMLYTVLESDAKSNDNIISRYFNDYMITSALFLDMGASGSKCVGFCFYIYKFAKKKLQKGINGQVAM